MISESLTNETSWCNFDSKADDIYIIVNYSLLIYIILNIDTQMAHNERRIVCQCLKKNLNLEYDQQKI